MLKNDLFLTIKSPGGGDFRKNFLPPGDFRKKNCVPPPGNSTLPGRGVGTEKNWSFHRFLWHTVHLEQGFYRYILENPCWDHFLLLFFDFSKSLRNQHFLGKWKDRGSGMIQKWNPGGSGQVAGKARGSGHTFEWKPGGCPGGMVNRKI